MTKKLFSHPVKALALALGLFSSITFAADAPLKVGTTAAFAIPLEAAVEEARKQGLQVDLVEFSDWIAPNVSLAPATST
jgi:ABC-type metal ion transport system, periplasmic component/surface antigen